MSNVEIIIVEDEAIVAEEISNVLDDAGYQVTGKFDNAEQAIELFKKQPADLIMIDIYLKGPKDGIELAEEINKTKSTPVIYLTSYSDERTFRRARQTHPSAYIIKPFDERELLYAIDLALENFSTGRTSEMNPAPKAGAEPESKNHYIMEDRIFIKRRSRFIRLELSEILWVEAKSNYIEINTRKNKYVISLTLKSFHEKIETPRFIRVHRSYIINIEHVDSFEENRIFIAGKEIPVSATYKSNFLNRIQTL